ncbi:hypothetical protein H1C71_037576, partial [Ictidomys tridecemlineatus]
LVPRLHGLDARPEQQGDVHRHGDPHPRPYTGRPTSAAGDRRDNPATGGPFRFCTLPPGNGDARRKVPACAQILWLEKKGSCLGLSPRASAPSSSCEPRVAWPRTDFRVPREREERGAERPASLSWSPD